MNQSTRDVVSLYFLDNNSLSSLELDSKIFFLVGWVAKWPGSFMFGTRIPTVDEQKPSPFEWRVHSMHWPHSNDFFNKFQWVHSLKHIWHYYSRKHSIDITPMSFYSFRVDTIRFGSRKSDEIVFCGTTVQLIRISSDQIVSSSDCPSDGGGFPRNTNSFQFRTPSQILGRRDVCSSQWIWANGMKHWML